MMTAVDGPRTAASVGLDPESAYSRHVLARLVNFTSDETPWTRRLWDLGTVLSLRELHEAGQWIDQKVLSAAAVDWQRLAVKRLVGPDLGVGDKATRRELGLVLGQSLHYASDARRRLHELVQLVEVGYLRRWAHEAESDAPPAPERLARAVAASLLDSGYSAAHLQEWLHAAQGTRSAAEWTHSAADLMDAKDLSLEVIVPMVEVPEGEPAPRKMAHWLPAGDVVGWLERNGSPPLATKIEGAFLFKVLARDGRAAVQTAADQIERMHARASFGRAKGRLIPSRDAYVAGRSDPLPLAVVERGVDLLSLRMNKQVYSVGLGTIQAQGTRKRAAVDDALELASALNQGAMAPALSGGWAALEALLTEPRDPEEGGRVVAATRAANLIACGWPRAEFTTLSYRIDQDSDNELARALGPLEKAKDRILVLEEHMRAGTHIPILPGWRHGADLAAVERMRNVTKNPKAEIVEVQFYLEASLRRLYRARNIVVHGGSTSGIALPATLRVAAPLVGAALDRIAHAYLVEGVSPLAIASRADMSIRLLDSESEPRVTQLLGH